MIDLDRCKKIFIDYTEKFDQSNFIINRKIGHTMEVMHLSGKIAEELKLSEEEKDLATLIGLLHDIGRFKQAQNTNSCKDSENSDHASIGVYILFEENMIQEFIPDTRKYDNIIRNAVGEHSRFSINENLTDIEMKFAKIIRDADKLDIYRLLSEGAFFDMAKSSGFSDNTHFTSEVLEAFYNNKQLPRNKLKTTLDYFLNTIAFVYDINYNISFKILKEKRYLEPILDIGTEINDQEQDEIEKIKKHINKYVEEKLV